MRHNAGTNCITPRIANTIKGKSTVSQKSSSVGAAKSKASSTAKAAATKPSASTKKAAKSASDASSASDTSTETPADSGAEKSADSGAKQSGDAGTEKSAKSGGEKAQKETVSSSDVHYGYFSSVRTPAYRKGWDDIFGNKKSSDADDEEDGTAVRAKNARSTKRSTIKQPITLELDIAELPEELRAALTDEVRRRVKRQRVNYDKLDKAGAVRWNIVCEIRR